jgi:hypothetical protein
MKVWGRSCSMPSSNVQQAAARKAVQKQLREICVLRPEREQERPSNEDSPEAVSFPRGRRRRGNERGRQLRRHYSSPNPLSKDDGAGSRLTLVQALRFVG